jgi:hypothetical protein
MNNNEEFLETSCKINGWLVRIENKLQGSLNLAGYALPNIACPPLVEAFYSLSPGLRSGKSTCDPCKSFVASLAQHHGKLKPFSSRTFNLTREPALVKSTNRSSLAGCWSCS